MVALAAGGFFFWQSRQPGAAAETAQASPAAEPAENGDALETQPAPTATLPVVSAGAAPGAQETAAPVPAVTGIAGPRASDPTQASPPAASLTPAAAMSTAPPTAASTPALEATPAATVSSSSAPVPAATPTRPGNNSTAPAAGPDVLALARGMLALVNADRAANGLGPVEWDAVAAEAGQRHSEEMARFGYMSHWNMDGYGPEYRYSRAGGLDMAQENVYRLVHQWEDGRGAPIDDWEKVVADAQDAWMNSPGHRANILSPEHTHVGIGIAYNPASGNVAMAQEFVNRYVTIEPLPRRAQPGDRLVLRGTLLPGGANPLVNLAYEPFPEPLTLDQLNKTGTYKTAAQHLSVPQVRTDANGRFVSEFTLANDAPPGLYHVWLWVEAGGASERVQAVDAIVEVSG